MYIYIYMYMYIIIIHIYIESIHVHRSRCLLLVRRSSGFPKALVHLRGLGLCGLCKSVVALDWVLELPT